jgi:TonB family protein
MPGVIPLSLNHAVWSKLMRHKLIFTFFMVAAVLLAGLHIVIGASSNAAVVEPPPVVAAIPPPYPIVALAIHASGEVTVEIAINAKGAVISAKASGHKLLAGAAERAAKQWRFTPVTDGSNRTATMVFSFQIMSPCTPAADLTPIFYPPYKVEVRGEQPSPMPSDMSPAEWEKVRCKKP